MSLSTASNPIKCVNDSYPNLDMPDPRPHPLGVTTRSSPVTAPAEPGSTITCSCCGSTTELRRCCGVFPVLQSDDGYAGSVRFECPVCMSTTIPCYSTQGSSVMLAANTWNSAEKQTEELMKDKNTEKKSVGEKKSAGDKTDVSGSLLEQLRAQALELRATDGYTIDGYTAKLLDLAAKEIERLQLLVSKLPCDAITMSALEAISGPHSNSERHAFMLELLRRLREHEEQYKGSRS